MLYFCKNEKNEITLCDSITKEKFNFEVLKEITEEEYKNNNSNWYIDNGEIKLGLPQSTIYNNEILELKYWFDNIYQYQEQKYRRLHTLNILTDEGNNPYEELIKLYNEAETKRKRIQELEKLI